MAIIDRIKHEFQPDQLVWKYEKDNITMGAQVIVNESQEALFFKGGQALDLLGPGTHTLSTKNLPLLQKLVNLPFGSETPFAAEVFLINKVARLDYKWGTRTPIPVEDPKYKVLISVGCNGQFGLRVSDSRVFITQIVGTMPEWRGGAVLSYFQGVIVTRVKDAVAKFVIQQNISVASITGYIDAISQIVEERLREEFAKYGLELLKFFVQTISIPDDELKRIQKGAFDRLEIDQLGDDKYQMKRSLDVLQTAANNPGAPGSLMSAGIGLGVGAQMAGSFSQITQQTVQSAGAPKAAPAAPCPKCQAPVPSGTRFCGQCGIAISPGNTCPACAATLDVDAKFCSKCGAKTGCAAKCPHCAAEIAGGVKFCPQCGKAIS